MSKTRSIDRSASSTNGADAANAPNADLHRVREILFGEHERLTAERIAAMERRIGKIEEQAAALRDLGGSLRGELGAVEKRLAAALSDASTGDQKSRDQLRDEVLAQIGELKDQKLDRSALAGLLGGLAERLGERPDGGKNDAGGGAKKDAR